MYILDVIALARIPGLDTQVLSYFSPHALEKGALVRAPLGRREVPGLVVAAYDARSVKMGIKKASFGVKSINRVIVHEPVLSAAQFSLLSWCSEYYYVPFSAFANLFVPGYLGRRRTQLVLEQDGRSPTEKREAHQPLLIMTEDRIDEYAEAVRNCLLEGKQALMLAPEIARAEELARTLTSLEPLVVTSEGTPKQNFEKWNRVRRSRARFIIGTRSAAFLPFCDLGLVVIDEEQSPHFRSWDMTPHYDVRAVARELAALHGALLVFGSGAPSVETYGKALQGAHRIVTSEKRREELPPAAFVDMRNELVDKNYSSLSFRLRGALEDMLAARTEQAFLFVSRRGNEPFYFCQDCEHIERCKRCDSYLVRHTAPREVLLCHICGFMKAPSPVCVKCGSHRIRAFGAGTRKVREELEKLVGYGDTLVLDSDSAPTPAKQRDIVERFASGESRILIGTSTALNKPAMPKVALAAIVSLDNLLYLPDYGASERIFQVARSVRSYCKPGGGFLFQTNTPHAEAIQHAALQDYPRFAREELALRRELRYPPYAKVIKLTFSGPDRANTEQEALYAAEAITRAAAGADAAVSGPAPAYIPRVRNNYVFHLIIKTGDIPLKERNRLLTLAGRGAAFDIDPESLL